VTGSLLMVTTGWGKTLTERERLEQELLEMGDKDFDILLYRLGQDMLVRSPTLSAVLEEARQRLKEGWAMND
jgi:hypothetical protein